jgi:hypothetical protein
MSDILSREDFDAELLEIGGHHDCPPGLHCTARALRQHDAAQRQRIDDLEHLLRRIVDTWPRSEQSMGPTYYFCPACGMRCPDGEKCLMREVRRLGVLP